jgi:hypothetical protein
LLCYYDNKKFGNKILQKEKNLKKNAKKWTPHKTFSFSTDVFCEQFCIYNILLFLGNVLLSNTQSKLCALKILAVENNL